MDAAGQPALAVLSGEVVYTAEQPLRQVRAEAGTAQVSFTGGSQMHYDLQLVGVGNLRTVITGAWAETQPF